MSLDYTCRSSGPQPWATGRILTPAQRERKRAVNRLSHRRKRSLAETRSASLESKIEQLTAELEILRREKITEARHCRCPRQTRQTVEENSLWSSPLDAEAAERRGNTCSVSLDPFASSNYIPLDPWSVSNEPSEDSRICLPIRSDNSHSSSVPPQTLATSCQEVFNHILARALRLSRFEVCTNDTVNQDILVRAVLNGWNDVSEQYNGTTIFCPLWNLLRYLDKRIFCMSGFITRLCTLRMIHAMLLCFVGATPFNDLPAWYKPRPSQHKFQHALAVDVLPWPGVRERAVHSQGMTRDNKFWTDIIYRFRFHWPYDPTEAVDFNANTGLFALSGLFQNQVHNIHMWKMDLSFFTGFPELYDDIMPNLGDIERPFSCRLITNTESIFELAETSGDSDNPSAAQQPALPLPESWSENETDIDGTQ